MSGPPREAAFAAIFLRIRASFAVYESQCVVLHDQPHRYYLGTHEVREKDGYRTWFGGVETKKTYVSAHLIPVYAYPELLSSTPESLRKRMQGKSCFNFAREEEALFAQFDALLEGAAARFAEDGRLRIQSRQEKEGCVDRAGPPKPPVIY